MENAISKYRDDFLVGSKTVYNYVTFTNYTFIFYTQIVGIQNIGPNYYNELCHAKEYLINYTIEGEGNIVINGEHYVLKKGDLLMIPNYYHHILTPIDGKHWKFAFIHIFDNDIIGGIYKKIYAKHRYIMNKFPEEKVLPNIKKILNLIDENNKENEFKVSNCIYQLLMDICEQSDAFSSDTLDQNLASAINFIKQNFDKPLKLKDILEHTCYSKNHFEKLFKSRMNMTVQEYIAHLRLMKSQELILTTNMYFKEIAFQVGLSDYRSLVYLFKNCINMTPTEYRNRGSSMNITKDRVENEQR